MAFVAYPRSIEMIESCSVLATQRAIVVRPDNCKSEERISGTGSPRNDLCRATVMFVSLKVMLFASNLILFLASPPLCGFERLCLIGCGKWSSLFSKIVRVSQNAMLLLFAATDFSSTAIADGRSYLGLFHVVLLSPVE